MHNTSPSCSKVKVISADKYLFETNLMGHFLVSSISSLQTEGYLRPFEISLTGGFFGKKANGF